jgi:hypothetical protein
MNKAGLFLPTRFSPKSSKYLNFSSRFLDRLFFLLLLLLFFFSLLVLLLLFRVLIFPIIFEARRFWSLPNEHDLGLVSAPCYTTELGIIVELGDLVGYFAGFDKAPLIPDLNK